MAGSDTITSTPLDRETVEMIDSIKKHTGLTFRSEVIRFACFEVLTRLKKEQNE